MLTTWRGYRVVAGLAVVALWGLAGCSGDEDGPAATDGAGLSDASGDVAGGGDDSKAGTDVGSGAVDVAAGDAGAAADAGPAPGPSNVACPLSSRIGDFVIGHQEYGDWVTGKIKDRVSAQAVLQAKDKEGPCQLWQKVKANCQPKCDQTAQECTHDNGCQLYPVALDVGEVVVSGLIKPVKIFAKGATKKYDYTDFDDRAWKDGAKISLRAPGGGIGAIELHGVGVPPLVVPKGDWQMSAGKPLTLSWTGAPGDHRIHVTMNVDQHGTSPAEIVCDLEDTGSFDVPAKLVDALLAYRVSGAPSATLERRTVDSVSVKGGCVELVVAAQSDASLVLQ